MLPSGKEVKVLNPVGTFAFSLMDGKHAPEDIARAVTGEFAVDYPTALNDVKAFLVDVQATKWMLAPDDVSP